MTNTSGASSHHGHTQYVGMHTRYKRASVFAFVLARPRGPVRYFPSEVIKQVCVMTEQPADELKQTPGYRLYQSSMTHDLSEEIHLNKWSRLTTLFIFLCFLLSLEPHGCWQRWVTEGPCLFSLPLKTEITVWALKTISTLDVLRSTKAIKRNRLHKYKCYIMCW